MATKSEQIAPTVEDRLRSLYKLQKIYSEIDRIKTIRGELPMEVEDLENRIVGLKTRIEELSLAIRELEKKLNIETGNIQHAKLQIEKYNIDLNNIRNNREFDIINKEIELQHLDIELSNKHIAEHNEEIADRKAKIADAQSQLEDLQQILDEKKSELDEIIAETRQEEEALKEKAKALEPSIDERTLKAFKRIKNNKSNHGLGIVIVDRDACAGCFNRIPPQRQMEIKMRKKVIVCEYCGRIIIDPALAAEVDQ